MTAKQSKNPTGTRIFRIRLSRGTGVFSIFGKTPIHQEHAVTELTPDADRTNKQVELRWFTLSPARHALFRTLFRCVEMAVLT